MTDPCITHYPEDWCKLSQELASTITDFPCPLDPENALTKKLLHYQRASGEETEQKSPLFFHDYLFPQFCVHRLNNYGLKKLIGTGWSGNVYEACRPPKGGCSYVAKIIPITLSPTNFQREAKIAIMMGFYGIGPQVHETFQCGPKVIRFSYSRGPVCLREIGVIVSERLDITLFDWIRANIELDNFKDKFLTLIEKLLEKLTEMIEEWHIINLDLHPKNIMIRHKDNDIFIVDWGNASFITDDKIADIPQIVEAHFDEVQRTYSNPAELLLKKGIAPGK